MVRRPCPAYARPGRCCRATILAPAPLRQVRSHQHGHGLPVPVTANNVLRGTGHHRAECFFTADGGSIAVGGMTSFNSNVHINASVGGAIRIGGLCLIGPNVVMRTAGHRFDDPQRPIREQGHVVRDITIEDDVWIGAGAIILGGVHIGEGAVIGAGAVVVRDVAALAIAVGVPAKVIGSRKTVAAND